MNFRGKYLLTLSRKKDGNAICNIPVWYYIVLSRTASMYKMCLLGIAQSE